MYTGTDWKWLAIGGHARNVLVWRINSAYAGNIHKSLESYALCNASHDWRPPMKIRNKHTHKNTTQNQNETNDDVKIVENYARFNSIYDAR